jgi:hypothetical protein
VTRTFAILALVGALGGSAAGYEQRVHALLSGRGYGGAAIVGGSPAEDSAAVRALRERVWRAGAEARDPDLKRRFLARYPTLNAFDAWAMKRLFALNPDKRVAGFDDDVALPAGAVGADVYALASRLPDDDERNRDRYRRDAAHAILRDQWGQPLPDDPATLEMGSLSGLSSQAHAHYGLPRLAFSDDPAVLKSDPRRFAIPPTVHTFGAEFADSYTALAALASRLPGGQRLALTHAGAAAHHLEDVANQIHTVQVGLYAFFVDAKLQSIKEELLSMGGVLRPRPDFVSIGLGILSNHHLLAEALYAKHLLAPGDPVAARTAAAPADAELGRAFAHVPTGCTHGFGRALAEALIDRSSYEGADVYRTIRAAAQRRWSHAGQTFGDGDDPDAALQPNANLDAFYALEVAGAARARQTLEAWWTHFGACAALDATAEATVTEALLRDRLDALDAAEERARRFVAKPPAHQTRNWAWFGGELFALVVFVLVVVLLVRRRRGR